MKKIATILLGIAAIFVATAVYADTVLATNPTVNTFKSATSTSVIINIPEGFSGSVTTSYDGNNIQTTYSTSTALNNAQMDKINADIQAQEQAMDSFFQNQQKLFQRMWGDLGWNW